MIAPYGSWRSPITSDRIVAATVRLSSPKLSAGAVYWVETRPLEAGRGVVVRRGPNGEIADVTPPGFNVRTRVHEYGGGAYWLDGETVYFSNDADRRLYRQAPGAAPEPLVAAGPWRYADGLVDRARGRVVCIREDHSPTPEPANEIVGLPLDRGPAETLVSGADFYSSPRLSPDGRSLAWIEWDHPAMPWDATRLCVASVDADGRLGAAVLVAGGAGESVVQPEWAPDGTLYFVSDRNGWWNLYRRTPAGEVEPLVEMEAEFAYPHWVFDWRTYAIESAERAWCAFHDRDGWRLASLDLRTKRLTPVESPYRDFSHLAAAPGRLVCRAGAPDWPESIIEVTAGNGFEVDRSSSEVDDNLRPFVSQPEAVEFETRAPDGRPRTAYARYYPPHNPDFEAPEGELPPLIVLSHGGPTSQTSATLDWRVQFWTSRGFALVDVDYGGSSGYGREYRRRLNGEWGVVDVEDCVNAALHLVREGKADPHRLIVRGGSAGGYTTLMALCTRAVFAAGASHYGVSDLAALARDTHKFESRYLDGLVAPWPEGESVYDQRSPIRLAEDLTTPVIFFQGAEDKIVPPNQSEAMVEVLRAKGITTSYFLFDGEQHGFRRGENVKRALDAELYFYASVLLPKGLRF